METTRRSHDPALGEELLYVWDFYRDALRLLRSADEHSDDGGGRIDENLTNSHAGAGQLRREPT